MPPCTSMQGSIEEVRVRTLVMDDVDHWARTDLHRRHLLGGLESADDYLAAVLPSGRIAGKVGIRYDEQPGSGTLFQFDVAEDLRNRGIGTKLLAHAEQRIRDHGCDRATLVVEETNVAAIRLYRRAGYEVFGSESAEWEQEAPDGTTYLHRCECLQMQRALAIPPNTE